jgi:hypothetical protein
MGVRDSKAAAVVKAQKIRIAVSPNLEPDGI